MPRHQQARRGEAREHLLGDEWSGGSWTHTERERERERWSERWRERGLARGKLREHVESFRYPYVSTTAPVPAISISHPPRPLRAPCIHIHGQSPLGRCSRRLSVYPPPVQQCPARPVRASDSGTPSQNLEPEGCEISPAWPGSWLAWLGLGYGKTDVTTRLGGRGVCAAPTGVVAHPTRPSRARPHLADHGLMGFRCGTRASGFPSLLLSWEAGGLVLAFAPVKGREARG